MKAVIRRPNEETLNEACRRLSFGKLVAFPTETVYGLGGSVADESALREIFRMKGRPYTDPLIAHVTGLEMALGLVETKDSTLLVALKCLAEAFWPGPLTLVVKKHPSVSDLLTGGTDYVGLRAPQHDVARELISRFGAPLAAPSANLFGHVSPTLSAHVADDFASEDLLIVDGGACEVGIESTVAKISDEKIEILRPGKITKKQIEDTLQKQGVQKKVEVVEKFVRDTTEKNAAPGQLLKHYAPSLPTYLVSSELKKTGEEEELRVADCAVIDFAGHLQGLRARALSYQELSPSGDCGEASQNLFNALRMAEKTAAKAVLLAEPLRSEINKDELAGLFDRMFRAATGKRASVSPDFDRVYV